MSLFKSRDWWNEKCGVNETFNASHLCIQKQLIIVGSLEGFLRVYDPQSPSSEKPVHSTDLLLETQLPEPILALQSGRFSNTEGLHLAVLHPKKLCVMRLTVADDSSDIHSHCSLDFMYEHDLGLHGYSLLVGPFWLCVQSLKDGTLFFFENERAGMTCRLPALQLLPSPICYVLTTDSFIVCDSSWNLHSYNYQSVANATIDQQAARSGGVYNKLLSDWELELGEAAIDIQTTGPFIVALTERNLYCLKDSGLVLWTKRLDYHPMCCALQTPPDCPDSLVILVCSDANTLLVYKDNVVEWNCKLPFTPLVIKMATFRAIAGLMVLLSDSGQLNISYMGTQQVQYGFCPPPQRPFNYQRGLKEIEQLKQVIHTGKPNNEEAMEVDLNLDGQMSREYTETHQVVDALRGRLRIALSKRPLTDIRVTLTCSSTVVVTPSGICAQLDNHGEAVLPVQFYAKKTREIVSSLKVHVTAVALSAGGWSGKRSFTLPLQLAMKLSTPVREAVTKITLVTSQSAANLSHLFQDFSVNESMSNVVALEHGNGMVVSILASKSTNKYRLQSDNLVALALPIAELQRRLRIHFGKNLHIALDSPPPIQEMWAQMENHYVLQTNLKVETAKLSQATRQFQNIQRTFHTKIINARMSDVSGAFAALQLAHDYVLVCIQQVETLQKDCHDATHSLESTIDCALSLLRMGSKSATSQAIALLAKILLPVGEPSNTDQSWHKDVESKLNFLIRRWSPSSSAESAPVNSGSENREFNMANLKKCFFQAFDLLTKGLIQQNQK